MMKVHGRSGDRNQEFSPLDGRSDKEEINYYSHHNLCYSASLIDETK